MRVYKFLNIVIAAQMLSVHRINKDSNISSATIDKVLRPASCSSNDDRKGQ